MNPDSNGTAAPPRWAKVVDHGRCIGCHACTTACKSENEVPLSVTRTYVKYVDVGAFPQTRRSFQVTRCNQCEDPPCVPVCPTAAMFQRADGIVDFDKSACIGCKACIAACPYDAIFINPEDHSAEKCNFCAHRIDVGLEPACVVVCPTEALLIGDLNDPGSRVAHYANRQPVTVRRPEKGTRPKLFYAEASQATLDPLAAVNPGGGVFMWSEQGDVPHQVPGGHPGSGHVGGGSNSSAAAVLSYDVPHRAPWDFRVSLYTWTKAIAAGVFLVPLYLILTASLDATGVLWRVATPVVAGVFLGLTGALLIWDLEHPSRFYLIFLRPQWKSWLVRGGFIIGAYSLVLALHFFQGLRGQTPHPLLWFAGTGLAIMTGIYTAFLFGRSRGRDLWQSPLLPAHMLIQTILAGAGATALMSVYWEPAAGLPAARLFAWACLAHIVVVVGETLMVSPTAHARLAEHQMIRGRYRVPFWFSGVAIVLGMFAPWVGVPAVVLGLVGLYAYEHAFVQAGQSVPLA